MYNAGVSEQLERTLLVCTHLNTGTNPRLDSANRHWLAVLVTPAVREARNLRGVFPHRGLGTCYRTRPARSRILRHRSHRTTF